MKRLIIALVVVLAVTGSAVAVATGTGGRSYGIKVQHTTLSGDKSTSYWLAGGTPTNGRGLIFRYVLNASDGKLRNAFVGSVKCYSQVGNIARFSGKILKEVDVGNAPNGAYYEWAVQDNGTTGTPPDLISSIRANSPINCATSTLVPTQPVTGGRLVVKSGSDHSWDDDDWGHPDDSYMR